MPAGVLDGRSGSRTIRGLFDLSRARQALLSVAQPALAAVVALGGLPDARQMTLGLIAATSGFLAVFSLNDVLDRKSDVRALERGKAVVEGYDLDTVYLRHPLAGGSISLGLALGWVLTLGIVSAIAAYLLDPLCLVLFGLAVALEALYCSLRSVTWTKTFVSGVMVGVGGLAGWVAVAPLSMRALPVFAFLALWEIAGRNIPNDLADVATDTRTGIRTTATVLGTGRAARAVLAGAALLVAVVPALRLPATGALIVLLFTAWAMLLPALPLVSRPSASAASLYFNRASLLPAIILPVVILVLEVA